MTVGLDPFGVRLDVLAVLEVLVHDLALGGAHGVQRDGPPAPDRIDGRLIGLAVQRLLAARPVARSVDDHADAPTATIAVGRLEGQVLDGVDGLAVAPDEEAEVVAGEDAVNAFLVLLHAHLGVEAERSLDHLEHLPHALGGLWPLRFRLAHLRLPERFFLRRGGAGGGPLGRPFGSLPATTGLLVAFGARVRKSGPSPPSSSSPSPLSFLIMSPSDSDSWPGGRSGPRRLRTIACCTIVHRFVVIQYTSRPAGNCHTNRTKKKGSARKIIRCVLSVVVDISSVEASC